MSRYHSYIRTAQQMIEGYDGSLPFTHFAKTFFGKEKKYGSTDRRQISALCYHYFRTAKALCNMAIEEKLIAASFLCEVKPSRLLEALKPEWNNNIALPVKEKTQLVGDDFQKENLFPFSQYLSPEIDKDAFAFSFLTQPDLFLRMRPGYEKEVKNKLITASIFFEEINNHCLRLPNGSKIAEAVELNKEAVVQDYNSQQTGAVIQQYVLNYLPQINSWDCCTASGGKSLMLHDLRPDVNVAVSDVRTSILHNLQQRFQQAGIRNYQSFVADVSKAAIPFPGNKLFNVIIADVPCTGSGTWARTPEQCFFFKEKQIDIYARRQKDIVMNAFPFIQPGGYFVYITCSVFLQENEMIIEQFVQEKKVRLVHMQYLKGFTIRADNLFIAVLQHMK